MNPDVEAMNDRIRMELEEKARLMAETFSRTLGCRCPMLKVPDF
jgi:hypothetical protein